MNIQQAIEKIESLLGEQYSSVYNRADDLEAMRYLVGFAKFALDVLPEHASKPWMNDEIKVEPRRVKIISPVSLVYPGPDDTDEAKQEIAATNLKRIMKGIAKGTKLLWVGDPTGNFINGVVGDTTRASIDLLLPRGVFPTLKANTMKQNRYGQYVSIVEIYEGGAMNIYLKYFGYEHASEVIRVR